MNQDIKQILTQKIRNIPNYPIEGVVFRDITTLLGDREAFSKAIEAMVAPFKDLKIDKVAGIEARGFILGGAIAYKLGAGFIPIRKKGKLPFETVRVAYSLEYAVDEMEMHRDAVKEGERILVIDDLIATGGTALAAIKLLQKMQSKVVSACFVINLPELKGDKKIEALGVPVQALLEFSDKD